MFDKCEFITSITNIKNSPNVLGKDEFLFCGRSNVGKSSLINAICKRKSLAKISSKPGKTITVNFFEIDNAFYLVDVPGYGYAKRSLGEIEGFGKAIENYIDNSKHLRLAFLLVDTQVGPTKDDKLMYNYLLHKGLDICVLSTKCDKLGSTLRYKAVKKIKEELKNDNVIMTSSNSSIGISTVQELIYNSINE